MNRGVVIRWESSLPARTAGLVTHEAADPDCQREYDIIAVRRARLILCWPENFGGRLT
jgi:hypothetical protein